MVIHKDEKLALYRLADDSYNAERNSRGDTFRWIEIKDDETYRKWMGSPKGCGMTEREFEQLIIEKWWAPMECLRCSSGIFEGWYCDKVYQVYCKRCVEIIRVGELE